MMTSGGGQVVPRVPELTPRVSGVSNSKLEEFKTLMDKHRTEMAEQIKEVREIVLAVDERHEMLSNELDSKIRSRLEEQMSL